MKKYPEAYLGFDGLIESGKILAPALLGVLLYDAKDYLIRTPGKNRLTREILVPKWLDWWIGLTKEKELQYQTGDTPLMAHPNILPPEGIRERFEKSDQYTGMWNMATGEGTEAHRLVWRKSKQIVQTVVVYFEGRKYFEQHPGRREPCLPEAMRATMAALFGLLVTVAPDRPEDVSESEHYAGIFKRSGADINFTTRNNANWKKILERNHPDYQKWALIRTRGGHVSEITLGMMPDLSINTSDNARKLMTDRENELVQSGIPATYTSMERLTAK